MRDYAKKRQFLDERIEPKLSGSSKPTPRSAARPTNKMRAMIEKQPAKRYRLGPLLVVFIIVLILVSGVNKIVKEYHSQQNISVMEFVKNLIHKHPAKKVAKPDVQQNQNTQPQGPTFDFYTVLPGQSNAMPTLQNTPAPMPTTPNTANGNTDSAANSTTTAPAKSAEYALVIGAYKNRQQAQDMRSRLSLMNVSSYITEATVHDKLLYRVVVGPFKSKDDASNVRDEIQQQGVLGASIMSLND